MPPHSKHSYPAFGDSARSIYHFSPELGTCLVTALQCTLFNPLLRQGMCM